MVTDIRNFGAIAQSATCTGVHAIIIRQKDSAAITPEAVKASAGALLKIPVCRTHSLVNVLEFLHPNGLTTFAADVKGKSPLYQMELSVPRADIVGSEDEGIQQALLSCVNHRFIIPQTDMADPFKVSVATGIRLYELMPQRSA